MQDPLTRGLLEKISVSIDPQLDAAFPAQRAARVAIRTRDGRREEWLQPTRVGDPDAPLSDAQLEDKFLELAMPVLGEKRAKEKLVQLWSLGTQ
jgi:2-methylcitrate dehydratase PrpD